MIISVLFMLLYTELTIQNFCDNNILQWRPLIFENRYNKTQQMMPLLCLSLCDLELKNAPEKNNNAFIKLKIFLKTHFIQIN